MGIARWFFGHVQLFDLDEELAVRFVEGHDARVVPHNFDQTVGRLLLDRINDAAEELALPTRLKRGILISIIFNCILGTLQVIIDEETERCFEKVIPRTRLDQGLLEVLLADLVVSLDHFGNLGVIFNQNSQIGPFSVHLVGLTQLVINLVQAGSLLVEFSSLFIVVVLFELISAILAHGASLGHPADYLVQLDCLFDELQVPLRVVLLHAKSSLFEMIRLKAVIRLALDAFEVHLDGLLRVFRMLIAVRSLLVQIFRFIFTILLRAEHIAEESAF